MIKTTYNMRLSEQAALIWRDKQFVTEELPEALSTKYVQAVRRKLIEMFGSDYVITIRFIDERRIAAMVDDMRFSTFIYNERTITVIPVVKCPACSKDAFLGAVEDMAGLGEALVEFEQGMRHECQ